jgi:8-oxo-dGTP pyrophosphatase MutT (NUDIX family)
MKEIVQSAGGIVYYLDKDWEPRYLLIKRHALSGKIERVAPKWKIQIWEDEKKAAIREIWEETWLKKEDLIIKQLLWTTSLRSSETKLWHLDKDVTYFLMKFTWDPNSVKLIEWEWYIWVYKRATIEEALWLMYYADIRELVRKSYFSIREEKKNQWVKASFFDKL